MESSISYESSNLASSSILIVKSSSSTEFLFESLILITSVASFFFSTLGVDVSEGLFSLIFGIIAVATVVTSVDS